MANVQLTVEQWIGITILLYLLLQFIIKTKQGPLWLCMAAINLAAFGAWFWVTTASISRFGFLIGMVCTFAAMGLMTYALLWPWRWYDAKGSAIDARFAGWLEAKLKGMW